MPLLEGNGDYDLIPSKEFKLFGLLVQKEAFDALHGVLVSWLNDPKDMQCELSRRSDQSILFQLIQDKQSVLTQHKPKMKFEIVCSRELMKVEFVTDYSCLSSLADDLLVYIDQLGKTKPSG